MLLANKQCDYETKYSVAAPQQDGFSTGDLGTNDMRMKITSGSDLD
jgi:hypothetical protein